MTRPHRRDATERTAESCQSPVRRLAIVPARGGSRRIAHKNVRPLAGKPLIAWTLDALLEAACFDLIVVSTDDPAIAAVARQHGARVFWRRPALGADDVPASAPIAEVRAAIGHDLYGSFLPTWPLRNPRAIRAGVAALLAGQAQTVRTVIDDGVIAGRGRVIRSVSAMAINWRWSPPAKPGSATNERLVWLTPDEAIDIDTWADWARAHEVLTRRPPGGCQKTQNGGGTVGGGMLSPVRG